MTTPEYQLYIHSDSVEITCLGLGETSFGQLEDEAELPLRDGFLEQVSEGFIDELLNDEENGIFIDNKFMPEDNLDPQGRPSIGEDRLELITEDRYEYIKYRLELFDDYYPFVLHNTVLKTKATLSDFNKLYLYLLACSNLKTFKGSLLHNLTDLFEELSCECLKMIYRDWVTVERFKSSSRPNSSLFSGLLQDKLKTLADQLGLKSDLTAPNLNPMNYGDGGIDIVAYPKFRTAISSLPVIFAQCACTTEWTSKQFSVHPDNWKSLINFDFSPTPMIFIPFSYRNPQGKWFNSGKVAAAAVMDRSRIIELFEKSDNKVLIDKINNLVDQITVVYQNKHKL